MGLSYFQHALKNQEGCGRPVPSYPDLELQIHRPEAIDRTTILRLGLAPNRVLL